MSRNDEIEYKLSEWSQAKIAKLLAISAKDIVIESGCTGIEALEFIVSVAENQIIGVEDEASY